MRYALLCIMALLPFLIMAQEPTMDNWTIAWRNIDRKAFKGIYSDRASIFPPNKPVVKGNGAIFEYMESGMGKVDVVFEPNMKVIGNRLAYESGKFSDREVNSQEVKGNGFYSVTWILEKGKWKIVFHTWSMPDKIQ